jgi:hypothetical protein
MSPPAYEPRDFQDAAGALHEILRWVAAPVAGGSRQHLRGVRNRALALAWSISPESVGGLSMSQLARRIGVAPKTLTVYTAEVRARFGIRNRYHVHDWRRR